MTASTNPIGKPPAAASSWSSAARAAAPSSGDRNGSATSACRFDLDWHKVSGKGRIYSWERPWHPVHPALKDHGPYIVVLVELPDAGNVRMLGNLLGDPKQDVPIGADVEAVFEHHNDAQPPFSLVQWRLV